MNQLISFLTSEEIIVVYIVAAVACVLCLSVYLVEKYKNKIRLKNNTRQLNKLVLESEEDIEESIPEVSNTPVIIEEVKEEVPALKVEQQEEVEEELQYTTIEPDQRTAKLELQKMKEELEKLKMAEEVEPEEVVEEIKEEETNEVVEQVDTTEDKVVPVETLEEESQEVEAENINLNNYEEEQEEAAIISLDELIKKSKELYENNELAQYEDEGTEPISLQELEEKKVVRSEEWYDEPFIISEVVPEEEQEEVVEIKQEKLVLDDFNSVRIDEVKDTKKEETKFKNSPIISPIFGIEKQIEELSPAEMELENTANYEKLDEEIRKTNEFLMTLRELQKKLDN